METFSVNCNALGLVAVFCREEENQAIDDKTMNIYIT
jgi:hypothetical protein